MEFKLGSSGKVFLNCGAIQEKAIHHISNIYLLPTFSFSAGRHNHWKGSHTEMESIIHVSWLCKLTLSNSCVYIPKFLFAFQLIHYDDNTNFAHLPPRTSMGVGTRSSSLSQSMLFSLIGHNPVPSTIHPSTTFDPGFPDLNRKEPPIQFAALCFRQGDFLGIERTEVVETFPSPSLGERCGYWEKLSLEEFFFYQHLRILFLDAISERT